MASTTTLRWTPIAWGVALAFGPALSMAQVNAATGGPQVTAALNGVPMVNIVAPNSAGVSHNLYSRFNVSSNGLILNNATQPTVTQLAGAVLPNPNFHGNSASLILNEVVQSNPSALNGFVEVAGVPADVVLANPEGISCNGCGFINTPRVTLTTGTPNLSAAGALAGFSVRGGEIDITGAGLDGTRQNYFDILARAVRLTGQINAKDLQIVGGSADFDYASRSATAVAGGAQAPLFAIDSSVFGGMYADRIRLIATENGVGVRTLGDVAASVDDITLSSAGDIVFQGKMSAARDVAITYTGNQPAANAISISDGASQATIAAARNLTVDAGVGGVTLSGAVLGGNADTTFVASTVTDNGGAGAVRFAGQNLSLTSPGAVAISGASWNGSGALDMNAATLQLGPGAVLTSATQGVASGSVALSSSGDMTLTGATVASGTTLALTSGNGALSIDGTSKLDAGGAANLTEATSLTNQGTIDAGGALTVRSDKSTGTLTVDNAGSGVIDAAGAVSIAGFDSGGGPNSAVNLTNATSASIAGASFLVQTQSFVNQGDIQGQASSTINASTFQNSGKIIGSVANGPVSIVAASIDNQGTVQSGGALSVSASTLLNNSGSLLSVGDLTLTPGTSALNNSGIIQAGGNLTLDAPSITLTNAAGAQILGGTLSLALADVQNSGVIQGTTSTDLTAQTFANVTAGSALIASTAGSATSNLSANTWSNAGTIFSTGPLNMTVASLDNGSTGAIVGMNTVTITGQDPLSSTVTNEAGALIFGGTALTIQNVNSVTNDLAYGPTPTSPTQIGEIQTSGVLTINAPGSIVNQGFIDGDLGVNLTTGLFINQTIEPPMGSGTVGFVPGSATPIGDASTLTINPELQFLEVTEPPSSNPTNIANPLFVPDDAGTPLTGAAAQFYTVLVPPLWEAQSPIDANLSPLVEQLFSTLGLYRNWSGQVYMGPGYDRNLVLAHVISVGGSVNITILPGTFTMGSENIGGQIEAAQDINFSSGVPGLIGSFTNQSISHTETVYNAMGTEEWQAGNTDPLTELALSTQDLYPFALVNPMVSYLLTSGSQGTIPVTFAPATLQAGGTVSFNHVTPAQFSSAAINANGAATRGVTPVSGSSLNSPLNIAGLSLILPSNPNGLFIFNQTSNASFLIESNPKYTSLLNPGLGSDYLINQLGLNPDAVIERLGDASYEDLLVQQEISAQTGLALIDGATTQTAQMQDLMNNAVWAAKDMKLALGVALTQAQVDSLKGDIVWMVQTVVDGHTVLAPVVYLSNATRAGLANGSQIVATNMAVSGADSFSNVGSTVNVSNNLAIQTAGDITNTGGKISGGNVALNSSNGNISSTTTVERYGDDANYTDVVGRQASITATGDLNVNAAQGNVTATGSTISAGQNATINAGGDVTVQNIVLEKKTTTETHSGNWLTGESSKTVVTTTQNSVGSDLGAGKNLTVSAGKTFSLVGSQAHAGGDVGVAADQINIANSTTTDTEKIDTSSKGFASTGGGVGYQSSSSHLSSTETNVVASGLTGGDNVTLTGRKGVTIQGSDVASGNDLNVNTKNLVTEAAQNTSNTSTSSSGWSVGASIIGNGDQATVGISGSSSSASGNDASSIARVSTLSAGNNMNLNAQGGTIAQQGTQIFAGNNFNQTADTINMTAAQSSQTSSQTSETQGGGVQAGAYYNAQSAGEQAASGKVPGVGLPSVMIGATGSESNSNSNQAGTQAVVATIVARGNVNSTSTGTTTLEGTQIQSGNYATIKAGTLNYTAAQDTTTQSNSSSSTSGGIQGGIDAAGKPVGGAEGSYSSDNGSANSTTAVVGSLSSTRGTVIDTTGDANLTGTQLASSGSTSLAAGGNVNFTAATNTSSSSSSSQSYSGSVGQDQSGAGDNKQFSASASQSSGNASGTTAVAGSITSKGGVTVSAGTNSDLTLEGTVVQSRGNVALSAGRDVNLNAATSTSQSSNSSFDASLSGGKGDKDKDSFNGAGGSNGNGSFDVAGGDTNSVTATGGVIQGRNISIASGRDTNMVGTQVAANGAATVNAGRALNMQSAQSSASGSSSSYGGQLGATGSSTVLGSSGEDKHENGAGQVGFNYGNASNNSVTNQNAMVSGGNVAITTGGDMTMQGANVRGGEVTANVGGNLTIASRTDSNNSSSMGVGGYAGYADIGARPGKQGQYGGDLRTGLSGSYSSDSSNSTTIGTASGIMSANSTTVNVLTGNTSLTGAMISTDSGGGGTILNSRSVNGASVGQSSSQSGVGFSGGLSSTVAQLPGISHDNAPSTSSTTQSMVGGQPIQANVSVAAVSQVLQQPVVQIALLLGRGMHAAMTTYGSADAVPVDAMRKILTDAGVTPPANASASDLRVLFTNAVVHGKNTMVQDLAHNNIPGAQIDSLVKAINVGS